MEKKLGLLIGSGVSCAVGYPRMSKITEKVFSGDGVVRDIGVREYSLVPDHDGGPCDWTYAVCNLLKSLKRKTRNFYREVGREINYEDLYYIVRQIHDSLVGEYENPITVPFEIYLKKRLKTLESANPELFARLKILDYISLISFVDNACKYIEGIVSQMLTKKPEEPGKLQIFREAHDDAEVTSIDLFTLNYDNLIESLFSGWGIKYNDGFGTDDQGFNYYNSSLLDKYSSGNRIIKMHGSLDWFYFYDNKRIARVATESGGTPDLPADRRNQMSQSLILIGTFNKMLEYTRSIFNDMLCHFNRGMRCIDRLIISGYGFGDKGINSVLANWFSQNKNNRAVIIHHDPERLKKNARPAIGDNDRWYKLVNNGQLKLCPKKIEDATWEVVNSLLFD